MACRSTWACAMAVTAQRPQWPLKCLALGLTACEALWPIARATVNAPWGYAWSRVSVITLVPRTCAVRQALETWGQQQEALPLLLEKPGRTRQEPAALARAKCHAPRGCGVCGRATRRGRAPLSSRALQPVGHLQALEPAPASKAERVASTSSGRSSMVACAPMPAAIASTKGVGRDGVDARRGRGVAIACYQVEAVSVPPGAAAARSSAEGGYVTGRGPYRLRVCQRPWCTRGRARVDRPRDHGGARGVRIPSCSRPIRNNTSPWNRAFAGSESRRHQSGMAGETRTDCGLGYAHGGRVARVCDYPTAGPSVSPRPCSASPGIKVQRRRPQQPWSLPSLPR